ncbi:hypothetical protein BaRGS_00003560 [Batillaria attramentaria]|uniref:Uncharacterized protein n=1 Tax=Batillaria attramentaria TaxID=370345 RepID=A0ABD0M271_9CAEN
MNLTAPIDGDCNSRLQETSTVMVSKAETISRRKVLDILSEPRDFQRLVFGKSHSSGIPARDLVRCLKTFFVSYRYFVHDVSLNHQRGESKRGQVLQPSEIEVAS